MVARTFEEDTDRERFMPHKFCPPAPRAPHVTKRKEFKCWLILQLKHRGAALPPDPSYKDLQLALEPLLEAPPIREG
jgi:hypothetical protein